MLESGSALYLRCLCELCDVCLSVVQVVMLMNVLQGFMQYRVSGESMHLDVDTLNEKLKLRGAERLRTAMRPDEAFGMIFCLEGVILDMQQVPKPLQMTLQRGYFPGQGTIVTHRLKLATCACDEMKCSPAITCQAESLTHLQTWQRMVAYATDCLRCVMTLPIVTSKIAAGAAGCMDQGRREGRLTAS